MQNQLKLKKHDNIFLQYPDKIHEFARIDSMVMTTCVTAMDLFRGLGNGIEI